MLVDREDMGEESFLIIAVCLRQPREKTRTNSAALVFNDSLKRLLSCLAP